MNDDAVSQIKEPMGIQLSFCYDMFAHNLSWLNPEAWLATLWFRLNTDAVSHVLMSYKTPIKNTQAELETTNL